MQHILVSEVWGYIIILCRIGGMLLFCPGFAEVYVPQRVRLLIAVGVTATITPLISIPPYDLNPLIMLKNMMLEVFIGIFFGITIRLLTLTLETAGSIISQQIGFSNVMVFDPLTQGQSNLPGSFLGIGILIIIFQTNIHYLFFIGIFQSYQFIPCTDLSYFADFSKFTSDLISKTFLLSVQIASPFIVFAVLLMLALGILNKLLPQIQVFFISMPAQLALGLLAFITSLSYILSNFTEFFETIIRNLFKI